MSREQLDFLVNVNEEHVYTFLRNTLCQQRDPSCPRGCGENALRCHRAILFLRLPEMIPPVSDWTCLVIEGQSKTDGGGRLKSPLCAEGIEAWEREKVWKEQDGDRGRKRDYVEKKVITHVCRAKKPTLRMHERPRGATINPACPHIPLGDIQLNTARANICIMYRLIPSKCKWSWTFKFSQGQIRRGGSTDTGWY